MATKKTIVDLAASEGFQKGLEMALEIHRRIIHNLENGHTECAASIARDAAKMWQEDIHNERHFRRTYADIQDELDKDREDRFDTDPYDVGDRLKEDW